MTPAQDGPCGSGGQQNSGFGEATAEVPAGGRRRAASLAASRDEFDTDNMFCRMRG